MRFPFWPKYHINKQLSFLGILIVMLVSIPLFVPYAYSGIGEIVQGNRGGCCYSENHIFVTNLFDTCLNGRNESRIMLAITTKSITSRKKVVAPTLVG